MLPLAGVVAMASVKEKGSVGQGIMAVMMTSNVTRFYKNWVPEARPPQYPMNNASLYGSFPSSHTSFCFCGAGLVQKAYGFKRALPFYLYASAIGLSRIWLHCHYAHDVMAGAVLGAKIAFSSGHWFESLQWVPTPSHEGGMISWAVHF